MDTAQLPKRSLLENGDLPFSELMRFAAREGRHSRPIYQIHKWFARRLGCTFRALLIGAIQPATADFWEGYYESCDLSGLTVLDPFVGGGTSVVEAARLGATAIGIDVDPIACAVTSAELLAATSEDLTPAFRTLEESVGRKMASFHTVPRQRESRPVIHHFWVQVVTCPKCNHQAEAHPNYVLASEKGHAKFVFCRTCHEVQTLGKGRKHFVCSSCGVNTNLDEAPVQKGAFTCAHCSHEIALIDLGRTSEEPPKWRLFAVETAPRLTGQSVPMKQRSFRRASRSDQEAYSRATRALRRELATDPDFLPAQAIDTNGWSDTRLSDYGYRSWSHLFNDRQLLHLGRLARAIKRLPAQQKRLLGLAFSNHLTTNCMLTSYAGGWRRITPLFSIRAFRHVPRPVEVNPWASGTGRGTFPNAVRQIIRAIEFAKSPKEPRPRGGFRSVRSIPPVTAPRVFSGAAQNLTSIPDNSVDIVLTDPPYFDNVSYSELADFFQPWLEHIGIVPETKVRNALKREALRARRNDPQSIETFGSNLGAAFSEVSRALKPTGLLVFTFRHSTANAWLAMAKALDGQELRVVQVLPMPGEAGAGLHIHDGTSLWDAVLVFRKLPAITTPLYRKHVEAARSDALAWRERFRRHRKLPFSECDLVNLFRAHVVGASLGLYGRAAGVQIDILTALNELTST